MGNPSSRPRSIAVHHLATQLKRRAEEVRGLIDLAGRHQAADMARGDDLAIDLQQRLHDGLKAFVSSQQLRIALRTVPEAEVLPHRHPDRPQCLDQHPVDELARAALREGVVEGNHDQLLHAERRDQLGLHRKRRQQLRRVLRRHHRHRVRFKGQHAVRALDHLAVPEVNTIERAHGNLARAGLHLSQGNDLHGAKPT